MMLQPRLSWPHLRGRLPIATTVALILAGCGAGKPIEGGLTSPQASFTGIRLEPGAVTLGTSGTATFQVFAQFSDGSENLANTASFSATGGSIDPSGLYTAGAATGTFSVIASLLGISDTSDVVIASNPRALNAVVISPASGTALPGGTAQFAATGRLVDGSDSAVAVVWSATAGTVDGAGIYTAPTQTGTYLVMASLPDGSLADTVSVVVASLPPTLVSVVVTPGSASLQFGQTQRFVGSGRLSDGSTISVGLTWTANGGSVTSAGLYTAGSTVGNFRVIARAANGMADTSSVSVSAPAVTSLTMSPASITLEVGAGTQFTLRAVLSTGATTSTPSGITWTATGGTVTSSGVYTAGATPGDFQVIARAQSGVADTSAITIVTPPPSGSGPYPNRPASFTNSTELDFSQPVPPPPDNIDQAIQGAQSGWNMIFFGDHWSSVSDPTAPQSEPGVWLGNWPAGSYGGGVIGSGSGHGIGNVFTYAASGTNRLYMSMRVYFDFDASQWHPISNKFVNLEGDNSLILVQLMEGGYWRHAEELGCCGSSLFVDNAASAPGELHLPGQLSNMVVPVRRWTQIEVLVDIPNHVFKIWQDGELTTSAAPNFVSTEIRTVSWNAFRGGGGETLTSDLNWKYDHFFIAW